MKKVLCIILAAMLLILGACSNTIPRTELVYGIYCPEDAPTTFPKLYLKDDGNFSFNYKSMGAGVEKGTYDVEGNLLTLNCTDSEMVFTFEIAENYIIFDAENSSPIEQDQLTTPIVDGTKFLIRHEANR